MIALFNFETRQRIVKAFGGNWQFTMSGFRLNGIEKSDEEVLDLLLRRNKMLQGDLELFEFYFERIKENIG